MSDFEENFNNRFGSTKHALGNYLTAEEQGKIQAGLNGMQPGDMLNLSSYLGTSANRAIANNENFVTGFKEYVVNEANKTTFLEDPSANTSQFTVGYVEQFGRSFETTFDTNAPAFLQVNATSDAFWNAVDVATIFVPGRLDGNGKAATAEKVEHTNDGVEIIGGYGTDIQMDGHKIYSSNHAPLGQKSDAVYRLSDPSYRKTAKDVYFGENVITSYYEVRKNLENKSLYVGEINIDNILDLTNSDITDIMGIDYSRFTTVANDLDAIQKAEIYKYTNLVGNQAFDAGYNGVLFNSSRNLSENNRAIVLFEGRYRPDQIKKIIDERINKEKKNDQDKKD